MSNIFDQMNCELKGKDVYKYLIIDFLVYVLVPIYFIIVLWKTSVRDFGVWIIRTSMIGLYLSYLFFVGFWPMAFGSRLGVLLLCFFCACVVKSFFNKKTNVAFGTVNIQNILNTAIYVFIILYFSVGVIKAMSAAKIPDHSINLDFPLKNGKYYIVQGGDGAIINHHYEVSAQKYALDIVMLNAFGMRVKKLIPEYLEDYNIYESVVYSPVRGTVLKIVNLFEDHVLPITNEKDPAGNYIEIQLDNSHIIIILAHLKRDSFVVKEGECIKSGDPIARVGNSGNTTEPHLHIHAVLPDKGNPLFTGKGIPMTFQNRFLVRNSIIEQ